MKQHRETSFYRNRNHCRKRKVSPWKKRNWVCLIVPLKKRYYFQLDLLCCNYHAFDIHLNFLMEDAYGLLMNNNWRATWESNWITRTVIVIIMLSIKSRLSTMFHPIDTRNLRWLVALNFNMRWKLMILKYFMCKTCTTTEPSTTTFQYVFCPVCWLCDLCDLVDVASDIYLLFDVSMFLPTLLGCKTCSSFCSSLSQS